jgi:signal transduction histidine kinase
VTLFLGGIAAFLGLHHLWFWRQRRDERIHAWMIALSGGTLTFLRGYHLQIWSPEPAPAILGARLQWTGGTVLVVVLVCLVNRFVGRSVPPGVFWTTALVGGAYGACVWLTETVVRTEAVLRTPAGGRPYWGVGLGPVALVFVPLTLAVAVYCITVLARARGVERFERAVLLSAFGFYLLAGINEVLGALRVIVSVRLFPPAFVALGVAFGLLLARRFDALARANERLLDAVRAQASALEERNAELDAFAYTVSHDLKAPLVAIEGMVDVLADQAPAALGESAGHRLARIRTSVRGMKRLIADLLAFSRVGREGHPPARIALRAVVDAVLDEFADAIRARGIRVAPPAPATAWGAPAHLEQVYRTLVGHALRGPGAGGASVIELTAVERGTMVECAVRDDGPGIDPADHATAFQAFARAGGADTDGPGIGLALVRKIVELNGGRLWVEPAVGHGATVRFTWPLAPAAVSRAASG